MENLTGGLGHNNPPEPTLLETLMQRYEARVTSAYALEAQTQDLQGPINLGNTDALERAAKFVRDCRAEWKAIDALRADEKKPFDDAGKMVQSFFANPLAKLKGGQDRAQRLLDDHAARLDAHNRQMAKEAADQARKEVDERLALAAQAEHSSAAMADQVMEFAQASQDTAAQLDHMAEHASAADMTRTHTEGGGVISASTNWTFVITEPEALRATMGRLGEYFTAAAIDQAVRAYVAAAKKAQRKPGLPGVTFTQATKALVR